MRISFLQFLCFAFASNSLLVHAVQVDDCNQLDIETDVSEPVNGEFHLTWYYFDVHQRLRLLN